jgi:hypothetical protein
VLKYRVMVQRGFVGGEHTNSISYQVSTSDPV